MALAATAEESQKAPRNSHGDWIFLRPHEWFCEVHIVTREEPQVCCCNWRKTRRFSPQREMRAFSTAASWEKSHLPSWSSNVSLTPLRQLKQFPDIPVSIQEEHRGSTTTQEEPHFSRFISRWGSIALLPRERNPGVPVASQEEAVSTWKSRGMPRVVPQSNRP